MVYVQSLKASTNIIKITKSSAIKWPLGLTPQHNVEGSWRDVGATVAGRVQEKRSFIPRKNTVGTFKGAE